MAFTNEIKTAKATVSLVNSKLIRILINENVEVGHNDILEINVAKYSLVKEQKHCVVL